MGIIGGFVGLFTFKGLRKLIGKYPAIGVAAWLSIFLAAEATAVEMWLAGTFPLVQGLVAMGIYHAFIGIIEAVLTVVVILALEKLRPDLLAWNRNKNIDEIKPETSEVTAK
jgi:cobalt/nickel transport system permease protein